MTRTAEGRDSELPGSSTTGRRPTTGRRVGIFGGTFDPPHVGHASVVADVADELGLDEVLWIPAGDPPHKSDTEPTPAPIRLRMVRAAVADDDRFRVSEVEIGRSGPSHTFDTLLELRAHELRDADVYLIMGVDQYGSLDSWHRPDEVRGLATLVVMDRRGMGIDPDEVEREKNIVHVPVRRVDVSSTRIRARVARDESIAGLVAPEVARIIEAEGLYRDESRSP